MFSGALEALVAVVLAICGAIFIFGQIKENAKRNEEDIDSIRKMIHGYQESMLALLKENMEEMKQLLDREKNNSREAWQNEIAHLRELVNINASETRADIQRLENSQKESNRIRERIAIAENSLKSLHKRLDIEPPITLRDIENRED